MSICHSESQLDIINTGGNLIVQASAGTGKTSTMVAKIQKEVEEHVTHRSIAAITFTIKAASEIKERLTMDTAQHFIGTNNSFVIEEVIKPFMKDVYGSEYDLDLNTDYQRKVDNFEEGLAEIKNNSLICSYADNTSNFIFELAQSIVEESYACRRYLQAKYFKIYIDEYQDCDKDMHSFFMYLCDELRIDTFIVGDEKQSIYMWRGAYPEAFKSILTKEIFSARKLTDNYRSCQQIQNYSNLLLEDTSYLYNPTDSLESIKWVKSDKDNEWETQVLKHLDTNQTIAVLRFSNVNAQLCADELLNSGIDCVYIPRLPISEITTEAAWFYMAVAKYCIVDKYSEYDFLDEIPVENTFDNKRIIEFRKKLQLLQENIKNENFSEFTSNIYTLAENISCSLDDKYIQVLYNTIIDESLHVAFEMDKYKHIAITFHSSKGLEFDQVIVFADDYRLNDEQSICNHYVAVTRAKSKLIIVRNISDWNADKFAKNLNSIFSDRGLSVKELVSFG